MKRSIVVCIAAVAFAGSAFAQGKAPENKPATGTPSTGTAATGTSAQGGSMDAKSGAQGGMGMDMSKMGPGARKPTNEKQAKKEIEDFFRKTEEASMKGGMDAMLAAIDFPVYMITDDTKGVPETKEYTREEYTAMMKPMYDNMPKDMKMTHKPTITLLSDSLANVVDDFSMTMGKQKITGRNMSFLVKRDGQWKWKVMAEAGWGGMGPPSGAGGSGQTPTEGKK